MSLIDKLKNLADKIRAKCGLTNEMTIDEMAVAVENISVGVDTSDATATAVDILADKTAYVNGEKVTGTMTDNGTVSKILDTTTTQYIIPAGKHSGNGIVGVSTESKTATPTTAEQTITPTSGKVLSKVTIGAMSTATQATPSISVSSSGLITASATQTAGYVASGTKSATKQLTAQAAKTFTPTTSDQTISSGIYLTGTQTIKGDNNLKAANIKSGTSIFGVTGTMQEGIGDMSALYNFTAAKSGTFSLSARQDTPYTFAHNLGIQPRLFFVYLDNTTDIYNRRNSIFIIQTCPEEYIEYKSTTSSGIYMETVINYEKDNGFDRGYTYFVTPYASSALSGSESDGSIGTMLCTSNWATANVNASTATINVRQYTSYLGTGTYKWLVMG